MSKASQRSRKPWDACAARCKGAEHYGNRGHLYRVVSSYGEHRRSPDDGTMLHPSIGTLKCARCGYVGGVGRPRWRQDELLEWTERQRQQTAGRKRAA